MSEESGRAVTQIAMDALIGAATMAVGTVGAFAPIYTTDFLGFGAIPFTNSIESVLRVITIVEFGLFAVIFIWVFIMMMADLGRDVRAWWGETHE